MTSVSLFFISSLKTRVWSWRSSSSSSSAAPSLPSVLTSLPLISSSQCDDLFEFYPVYERVVFALVTQPYAWTDTCSRFKCLSNTVCTHAIREPQRKCEKCIVSAYVTYAYTHACTYTSILCFARTVCQLSMAECCLARAFRIRWRLRSSAHVHIRVQAHQHSHTHQKTIETQVTKVFSVYAGGLVAVCIKIQNTHRILTVVIKLCIHRQTHKIGITHIHHGRMPFSQMRFYRIIARLDKCYCVDASDRI